jgi:ubiquinone/menaquinone biosynthesis C-methylase UbiE
MERLRLHAAIVALLLAGTLVVSTQQTTDVHPISGRRVAPIAGVEQAAWLDRPEREQEEAPEKALDVIGIANGSTVADVGAGSGYFTVRLAARVGPTGRVYANDIQPEMLAKLGARLAAAHIVNVDLIQGEVDDPKLPRSTFDLVLMVDVYHELSQPQEMLRHVRDALRPDGRLVLIEYRKGEEDPAIGADYLDAVIKIIRASQSVAEARDRLMKDLNLSQSQAESLLELQLFRLTGLERENITRRFAHSMSVAEAKAEVEAEGYHLSRVDDSLPTQHIFIFTKQ